MPVDPCETPAPPAIHVRRRDVYTDKSAPETLTFSAPLAASGGKLGIVVNACLAPPCLPLVVAVAPPSCAYIGGDALVGDAMGARGGGRAVWLPEMPRAVAVLAIAKRRAEARTGRRKRRKRPFALLSMAMGEGGM
ncbi:hypothetical protein ZWY2020_007787 [Hordeum vulgare]|nr:hypothetical protein ZWY2020_007787 [Hordeum vulgare]